MARRARRQRGGGAPRARRGRAMRSSWRPRDGRLVGVRRARGMVSPAARRPARASASFGESAPISIRGRRSSVVPPPGSPRGASFADATARITPGRRASAGDRDQRAPQLLDRPALARPRAAAPGRSPGRARAAGRGAGGAAAAGARRAGARGWAAVVGPDRVDAGQRLVQHERQRVEVRRARRPGVPRPARAPCRRPSRSRRRSASARRRRSRARRRSRSAWRACAGDVGRSGTSTFDGLTSRWTRPGRGRARARRRARSRSATMSRSDSRPPASSSVERRPADELGDEVRALVVDRGLVQGHDSRVREPRGGPGLALEAAADDRSRGRILIATSRSSRSSLRQPHGRERRRCRDGGAAGSGRGRSGRPARGAPRVVAALALGRCRRRSPGGPSRARSHGEVFHAATPLPAAGRQRDSARRTRVFRGPAPSPLPCNRSESPFRRPGGHTARFQFPQGASSVSFFDERRGDSNRASGGTASTPAVGWRVVGRRPRISRRSGPPHRRSRSSLVVVIILIALAVHSCEVSARNSALKDYNNNVASLIARSNQTGTSCFKILSSGGSSSEPHERLQTPQRRRVAGAQPAQRRQGPQRSRRGQGGPAELRAGAADARRRDHQHRQPDPAGARQPDQQGRGRHDRRRDGAFLRVRRRLQGLHVPQIVGALHAAGIAVGGAERTAAQRAASSSLDPVGDPDLRRRPRST